MKRCFKCSETKSLDEFYAHPAMGDGRLNKCKTCTRSEARKHRVKNLERVREYDRSRDRRPSRSKVSPEQRAAHIAVGNAVRSGKLEKLPCAFCGSTDRLEAHHHDYAKPLEVTWLCSGCHHRFHALERMAAYERDAA